MTSPHHVLKSQPNIFVVFWNGIYGMNWKAIGIDSQTPELKYLQYRNLTPE